MASEALVAPLLIRVGGNRATQRMCRTWFARFSPLTLELLADAPPEVFDFLVTRLVRTVMRHRRRTLWVVNSVALVQAVSTAANLSVGLNLFSFLCLAYGWRCCILMWARYTPEAMAPPFVIRIQELPTIVQQLQERSV